MNDDLRAAERAVILAAAEWHMSGEKLTEGDKAEMRFEKSLARLSEATAAYLKEALTIALDSTESHESDRQYGDGRVFKRRNQFWIAYYVDGKEIRQPAGNSEEAARTALVERKAIEAHAAALPKLHDEPPAKRVQKDYKKTSKNPVKTPLPERIAERLGKRIASTYPAPPKAPAPPNKKCADCEKPFHALGRSLRCADCMEKGNSFQSRSDETRKSLFADGRCLGCEEPFKSFQGQRHCDKCIKKRIERAKTNVGELDGVP
jgi:hypothetical protein